jgi:predicted ABC-type ATPase
MDLPVYLLDISEDMNDDAEVDYVALVDRPAIQKNWNAFKNQQRFEVVSEDKRIISGPLMLADVPIFRSDATYGDYYVVFSKDTIFKIAQKFFKRGYQSNVNLMHSPEAQVEGVTMFESFITDESRGIQPMKGFEDAPDGSWFGSFKVDNEGVWNDVKEGKFKGFSVEGLFTYKTKPTKEQELMNQVYKILEQVNFGGPGSGRRPEGGGDKEISTGNINGMTPKEIVEKYNKDAKANVDKLNNSTNPDYGTHILYQDKEGNYNEERTSLHRGIVQDKINQGSTNLGTSFFLGGAPATGKSSLEKSGQVVYPQGILRVDPDGIKAELPEYKLMANNKMSKAASLVHEESSKITKDIVNNAADNKFDAVIDTVGDGTFEKVAEKVKQQRDAGKRVVAHYVTTDVETSLTREAARAEKTGRKVPTDYIKSMHKEISVIFPKLATNNTFNELHLYDNNGSTPKLIYSKKDGKETILDANAYNKFLKKANG